MHPRAHEELRASAAADLPGWIRAVAAHYGVALTDTVHVRDFYEEAAKKAQLQYPALGIDWGGTVAQPRTADPRADDADTAGEREVSDTVVLTYKYRALDAAAIRRHLQYVPIALVLWLEHVPTIDDDETRVILSVLPADGSPNYEIVPDVIKQQDAPLIWCFDVAIRVSALHPTLPPRALAAAPPA